MKKNTLLLPFILLVFCAGLLPAQEKITPLVEHFTNSRCSVCASKNPGFYALYDQYKDQVNHIAYHPPVPYATCIFYQANKEGNEARQNVYGVVGTPVAFLDGIKPTGTLPTEAEYQAVLQKDAVFSISFISATREEVKIKVTTIKDLPDAEELNLFTAFIENRVNYNAPNGETVHHDVFRKFLRNENQGTKIVFPAGSSAGDHLIIDLGPVDYAGNWIAADFSLIAFLQDNSSTQIYQSQQSEISTSAGSFKVPLENMPVIIYPNPADEGGIIFIEAPDHRIKEVLIYDAGGKLVNTIYSQNNSSKLEVEIKDLKRGVYYLYFSSLDGMHSGRSKLIIGR